jgi:hypothetical protein
LEPPTRKDGSYCHGIQLAVMNRAISSLTPN